MITLYSEVQKAGKRYPRAVRRLRRMLKREEPELIKIVARQLKNTLSYTELRECVENGELTEKIWKNWTEDYSRFVNERMYPQWIKAMKEGAEELKSKKSQFIFDIQFSQTQQWLGQHGAEWIVQISDGQRNAINFLIKKAVSEEMTVDELAMFIRPTIGLYKGQVVANYHYYTTIKAGLLKANPQMKAVTAEKKAAEAAAKYAEKQHRYRTMNIARTELATAYHAGEYYSIKQAQREGLLGRMRKRASTAGDGRVCGDCQNVDGAEVWLDEEFLNGCLFPPFHPGCRCCMEYIEVEAPILKVIKEVKRMDFKINKTNEEKKQVFGWANIAVTKEGTPIQDLQNDMVEPEELEKAAYEHVLSFRSTGERHDPNLRQKGRLIESIVFTKEKLKAMNIAEGTLPYGWWIGYQIDDNATWEKIKKGEYQMFSIEGTAERRPVDKSNQKIRTVKSYQEIVKDL